jgi:hypothetical protein
MRVLMGDAYIALVVVPVMAVVSLVFLTGLMKIFDWDWMVNFFTILTLLLQIAGMLVAFAPKFVLTIAGGGALIGAIARGYTYTGGAEGAVKLYARYIGYLGAITGLAVILINWVPLQNYPAALVGILLAVTTLGFMLLSGMLSINDNKWGKRLAMLLGVTIALNVVMTLPGVADGRIKSVAKQVIGLEQVHPGEKTRLALESIEKKILENKDKKTARELGGILAKAARGEELTADEMEIVRRTKRESNFWYQTGNWVSQTVQNGDWYRFIGPAVGILAIILLLTYGLRALRKGGAAVSSATPTVAAIATAPSVATPKYVVAETEKKSGMGWFTKTLFILGLLAIALSVLDYVHPTWDVDLRNIFTKNAEKSAYAWEETPREWRVAKVEFSPGLPFAASVGTLRPSQAVIFLTERREKHYRAYAVVDLPDMVYQGKVYRRGVASFFAFPDARCVTERKTGEVECEGHWRVDFASSGTMKGAALIRSATVDGRPAVVAQLRNYPDQPQVEVGRITLVRERGAGAG